MKKTSNRILFFGNERLATGVTTTVPVFQGLVEAGIDVAAVVTNFSEPISRSAQNRKPEVMEAARAAGISVMTPDKLDQAATEIAALKAEAAVLVAYGRIVPQSIIDIFPRGIINIHPSLLPLHRGPTPIESVILQDEKYTGVSLMRLSAAMDAGPVYAQRKVDLTGTETKQELADRLLEMGRDLALEYLPAILSGNATATPQDDSQATYDKLINKSDGAIDWTESAAALARKVRAYWGWPQSRAKIGKFDVIITKATPISNPLTDSRSGVVDLTGGRLIVGCGQDSLEVLELKPPAKQAMTAEAFLAGYKISD